MKNRETWDHLIDAGATPMASVCGTDNKPLQNFSDGLQPWAQTILADVIAKRP